MAEFVFINEQQTMGVKPGLTTASLFCVLQGSYGVVKLAYNEDDDKHYVSRQTYLPVSNQ